MLYDEFQALVVPRFTIPFGVYSTIERWYAADKSTAFKQIWAGRTFGFGLTPVQFAVRYAVLAVTEYDAAYKRLGSDVDVEDNVDNRLYEVENYVAEIFRCGSKEYIRAVKDAKKQVDALLAFVNRW